MIELGEYRYGGARALVLLHEQHMRRFLTIWKRARAANLTFPETANEAYASLETLLAHVLWAAGYYLKWMCQQLDLPAPEIAPVPDLKSLSRAAEEHLEELLEEWRRPLATVPEEAFEAPEYAVSWAGHYNLETMLEHAVMHPIRHGFQLEELMDKADSK
jgi:uncharacterized damage-inducible protein DinB